MSRNREHLPVTLMFHRMHMRLITGFPSHLHMTNVVDQNLLLSNGICSSKPPAMGSIQVVSVSEIFSQG